MMRTPARLRCSAGSMLLSRTRTAGTTGVRIALASILGASLLVSQLSATSPALAGSATAPVCVAPPSGLVSWWPAEGNADDIGDGNYGALVNEATFSAGKVGQAFSLDGTNHYVSIANT